MRIREVSKKCVYLLGYQGNNLLCSDWDRSDMEGLDYNGLYEYLYRMKYGERYEFSGNTGGIPAEEFENLIMEFLPVTADQIKKWAVFDSEHQSYAWEQLVGGSNFTPTNFTKSLPEVVEIKEDEDGCMTLVINAVCDQFICDDAVITSELTVKFNEDSTFKYMGNKIPVSYTHLPDKEADPMAWTAHMNALMATAEESILTELVYS